MDCYSIIHMDNKANTNNFLNNLGYTEPAISIDCNISNDLKSNKENSISDKDLKNNHTYQKCVFNSHDIRFEDVPKDVLRSYGFYIEDSDTFKDASEPNTKEESDEEDGKLVIDESAPTKTFIPPISQSMEIVCNYTTCSYKFKDFQSRIAHEQLHCPKCCKFLDDRETLQSHIPKHCDFRGCGDLIENEADRAKHVKSHDHPLKPFVCNHCKKRFHFYRHCVKHRESCRDSKKLYSCSYCKVSFSKMNQYNKHTAKHENAIVCSDCHKPFVTWNIYSKHLLKSHNKQIVYQCNRCPKRFQYQDSMIQHIKCHNLNLVDCNLSHFIKIELIKK